VLAFQALREPGPSASDAEAQRAVVAAVDRVAARLGATRAV
jgi:hypothetical protein